MPWICAIYEERPDLCRRYPEPGSFVPQSCGYHFQGDGTRKGKCEVECEAACCRLPRQNGDPEGTSLPEAAGGIPCRHLTFTDKDVEFGGKSVERFDEPVSNQPDTAATEE